MFNESDFLRIDNQIYLSSQAHDYMIEGFFTCFLLGLFFMYCLMLFQEEFKRYVKNKMK